MDRSRLVVAQTRHARGRLPQLSNFVHGKPRFSTITAELDLHPAQAIVLRLLAEPPEPISELPAAERTLRDLLRGALEGEG